MIGKVEAANGGTLFLDEIGELPLPLQGKLLRFVQERQFERVGGRETLTADVRLVAATNRDLAAMAAAGQFRSDLYFRLRVVEIEIPPLRERGGDDITDLAEHFVAAVLAALSQGPAAARRRRRAPRWSRTRGRATCASSRTRSSARSCCASGPTIGVKDLGLRGRAGAERLADRHAGRCRRAARSTASRCRRASSLEEAERRYARAILDREGGNQSAAARALGISRNKLARLLRG